MMWCEPALHMAGELSHAFAFCNLATEFDRFSRKNQTERERESEEKKICALASNPCSIQCVNFVISSLETPRYFLRSHLLLSRPFNRS